MKLKLIAYTDLIKALPVRSQAFHSNRETWEKSLKPAPLPGELEGIFGSQSSVFISRRDIFDEATKTDPNLERIVYLTILWGYPTGMRNDYFSSIVERMHVLTQRLGKVREGGDWKAILDPVDKIYGLGFSTCSKLLYFLGIEVNAYDALILDQRLLAVFKNNVFDDFSGLEHLTYENALQDDNYLSYQKKMNDVARLLVVPTENIEMFLFAFGSQLK